MSKKASSPKIATSIKRANPAKKAAPAKIAGRQITGDKGTACFDGAGDLNPAKRKVGQPKER